MKHIYKICLSLGALLVVLIFSNASTGPGFNFNTGYTGASFDNNLYCSNCHSGGNFTPSVTLQLLSGATPVTNYTPGSAYTLSINVSSSTGVTPGTAYGFQVVAVRTFNDNNAGTWGSLSSTNYHSVVINGRTYVEHSSPLSSGSISIPWTAPGPGNGSVIFYAAGNVVDGMGGTTDDNATTNTLTIPVNPLPAIWLSFEGKMEKDKVRLEWVTTNEIENGFFILEKSTDGKQYAELARLAARQTTELQNSYTYEDVDAKTTNFYRIKHRDVSGTESTFKTIQINKTGSAAGITYIKEGQVIILLSGAKQQNAVTSIFALDGRLVSSRSVQLEEGSNKIILEKPTTFGIYLINIKNGSETIYTDKFLSE
ncbi:MAG TPA: hypothetical protein PL009_05260 [Flavipsychrobacter sp.]|nr:hypothetical protein [Flavipsychrobacter sp.]